MRPLISLKVCPTVSVILGFVLINLVIYIYTEMLPSLDNFLSYGSDVIKSHVDYKQMMVDIYTTSITNDQLGENDRVNGSKLAESILLNLRGAVDDVCYLNSLHLRKFLKH